MGVRPCQRTPAGHGRRQSDTRGLRRDHGDGVARAQRQRAIPSGRVVHRRAAGRPAGVRGCVAAGGVVSRRGWVIAILSAWVLSLGWLVKRAVFRPTGARLAAAALAVPPGALFYRLDVGGQQIGYSSTTIDTLPSALRVETVFVLDVPALGKLHRTTVRSTAMLSRALRLQSVVASFDGDIGRFERSEERRVGKECRSGWWPEH